MGTIGQCLPLVDIQHERISSPADFLLFPSQAWLLISTLMPETSVMRKLIRVNKVWCDFALNQIVEENPFITWMLTMTQVICAGLTWCPLRLHQLILLTLSSVSHLLSPSACQPIPASLSSLQPCRLCLKSFNTIRFCKYFFARCLPRTTQIENSCPKSVLFSFFKNKQQPGRRASPLNTPSPCNVA